MWVCLAEKVLVLSAPKIKPLLLHKYRLGSTVCSYVECLEGYKSRFWHCQIHIVHQHLSFNQACQETLVPQGRSYSLGWSQEWDHAGRGGSAVMKERTGGFGSWACLFVWECRGKTSLWCLAINLTWYLSTSSQEIAIRVISVCWLICTVITAGKYWSRKNKHIIHLNLQSTAFTWQFTLCNTQVYF